MGKFFRRRYQKLIGDKYSPDNVYIQSDVHDRNLMSASCNSYGLFPAHDYQVWKDEMDWQPIPVHQLSDSKQHLLSPKIECAKMDVSLLEYVQSDEVQSQLEMIKKLRKYMESHAGMPFDDLFSMMLIYDTLSIETLCGLP